jgi:twitching motility protein PilT
LGSLHRAYNDWILNVCLDYGWLDASHRATFLAEAEGDPELFALDWLHSKGLLNEEHVAWLRAQLAEAVAAGDAAEKVELPHPDHIGESVIEMGEVAEVFDSAEPYLEMAMEAGASDLHLGPSAVPILRRFGRLGPMFENAAPLTPPQSEKLARSVLTPAQQQKVETHGSIDFCYEHPRLGRFRSSVVRQRRGWESVFRIIPKNIRTLEELKLPPQIKRLTEYHNGLVLITGSVGSGKSTTLAALVEEINNHRTDHIITLEDPVEYVFDPKGCQISQREVHSHTKSFATALRAALREDPDVIMVGEMRDLETISLAITASETGHLVLGTLHTSTAGRTLDRLLDVFPIDQQPQIRVMVSESLRGIVCQQLVPRADGAGRVCASEILFNNGAVANLIRESRSFMLPGVIQTGRKQGMQLMEEVLCDYAEQGVITPAEALFRAENKSLVRDRLQIA